MSGSSIRDGSVTDRVFKSFQLFPSVRAVAGQILRAADRTVTYTQVGHEPNGQMLDSNCDQGKIQLEFTLPIPG